MLRRLIAVILISVFVGCVDTPTSVPSVTAPSTLTAVVPMLTDTNTPSATATTTATATETLTATVTATITNTPYPDTPTAIGTSTPGIIEVTPLGGDNPSARDYWQPLPTGTYYVPINNLFIRDFSEAIPPFDYVNQPKTGEMIYAGTRVEVFTIYHPYANPDRWLCIDLPQQVDKESACPRAIVYKLGLDTFGTLWLP